MKISILQFKSNFGEIKENFDTVTRLIDSISNNLPDVILLPELWSTGYYPKPLQNFSDHNGYKTSNFLATIAKKYNINIIGGTIIVDEDNKFYNRCFIFDRYGKNIAVYDKIHLFSMTNENEVFSAGNKIPMFNIDGIKSGITTCYDLRFPELFRKIALNKVSMIFLPAAWSLKRLEHWKILTRARAIENQIFIIAANSAGHSIIIDPSGNILNEGGNGTEILTVNINLKIIEEIKGIMNILADYRNSDDLMIT